MGNGGVLTLAARVYFADPAVDLQYLCGFTGGAVPYALVYRAASGLLILDSAADVSLPFAQGWHTVLVSQSATQTRFEIDGQVVTAGNAGKAGTGFVLFNRMLNSASQGFRGGVSRLVLAEADTWGTPAYDTAKLWYSL